jgi:hypothetical protein
LLFPFIVTPIVLAAVLSLFVAIPLIIYFIAPYALMIVIILTLSPVPVLSLLFLPFIKPLAVMGTNVAYGIGQLLLYPLTLGKVMLRTLITVKKYGLNYY